MNASHSPDFIMPPTIDVRADAASIDLVPNMEVIDPEVLASTSQHDLRLAMCGYVVLHKLHEPGSREPKLDFYKSADLRGIVRGMQTLRLLGGETEVDPIMPTKIWPAKQVTAYEYVKHARKGEVVHSPRFHQVQSDIAHDLAIHTFGTLMSTTGFKEIVSDSAKAALAGGNEYEITEVGRSIDLLTALLQGVAVDMGRTGESVRTKRIARHLSLSQQLSRTPRQNPAHCLEVARQQTAAIAELMQKELFLAA